MSEAKYRTVGLSETTNVPNVFWMPKSLCYRIYVRRQNKHFKRAFYVVDYGSKEAAFKAACDTREEFIAKYPINKHPNAKTGNLAWQALSNQPRKRPTSQLLEWYQQNK